MEMLGKYGLLEKLNEETSGAVYRAHDSSLNRDVMLITLGVDSSWDPARKESFLAECRAILRLRHPNLAAAYEQGEDRKMVYLVTEVLPGKRLRQLIVEKVVMTLEQKLELMIQVAGGLGHAHNEGVLHRSLAPDDIYVLPDGTVKVAGFGRGNVPPSPPIPSQSRHDAEIYLAPEQLLGKEATRQSDVFSIGLILYEFLTGIHPFHDDDSSKTVANILNRASFLTVEQFPDVPFNLWPILERCLAKEAEERYATMQDFASACQAVLGELAEDAEWMRIELQTSLPRLRKAAKRRDAAPGLAELKEEVEKALLRGDDSDYLSLNRLVLAMAEQHRSMDVSPEAASSTSEDAVENRAEDTPSANAAESLFVEPPVSAQDTKSDAPPAIVAEKLFVEPSVTAQDIKADTPPAIVAENSSIEPPVTSLDTKTDTPIVGGETDLEMRDEEVVSPMPAISQLAPMPTAEQSLDIPAPKTPEIHASDPLEKQIPRVAAKTTIAAVRVSSAMPASADTEAPQTRMSRRENLSELLRKIDQGQESTRKLVDNFLAGRQAMALAREQSSTGNSVIKPASVWTENPVPAPRPSITPSGVGPTADLPRRHGSSSHRKPHGDQSSPGENLSDTTAAIPAPTPRPARRKTALWICASTLLLVLAFAVPWVRDRLTTSLGKGFFSQSHAGRLIGTLPGKAQPEDPVGLAIQNQLKFARRDVLLEEAEVLHIIGRREESRVFLNRLLELYPGFTPALERLERIKNETTFPQDQEDQSKPAQKLIGSAYAAIKAGNLQKAKSDLDKAEQLQPGLPEVLTLRRQLDAKKAELAQKQARDQEEQLTAKREKDTEALVRRTEELYRQGKYDEALAVVDDHLMRNPTLPQTQELRSRTVEAKLNLKTYEAAVSAGRLAEARAALEKIERINPVDPNLPALRRRAEPAPPPGSASLSLYPIGEVAVLMLDDQPVGAGGELINQTISSGRHKLSARSNGRQVEQTSDFSNGQNITMVYDVAAQVLRVMNEADRPLITRSRARQEVHHFAVEHSHGLLRGSCKGDLSLDYYHVIFQPSAGPHGFSVSFKELSLRIENRNGVFLFAADGTEFFSFRLPDASTAQKLRKVWDGLTALGK
jgi:serine/threonine protein kinase/tetratricopeptide (TPR) repeat protein